MDETSFNQRLESLRNRNAKLEEDIKMILAAVDHVILGDEPITSDAMIEALIKTGYRHRNFYASFSTADFQTVRRGDSFHAMRGDKGATR
jgi:putative component of toxin-antitoxin plasmid stabilization module